jgi:AraC-like DNA-binding protein
MSWLERISPCIRLAGDGYAPPDWIEPLRVIYDHELVLFRGGDFIVEIDGRTYDCGRDSFLIVPPGRRHVSRCVSARGGHRYWAHFDWSYRGPLGRTPVLTYLPARTPASLYRPAPRYVPRGVLHGPMRSAEYAVELHQRLARRCETSNLHERLTGRALLLELLLELLDPAGAQAGGASPVGRLAAKVRTALDEIAGRRIADLPSIQEYLQRLGCSYAHLCREFHRAYGLSPLQYVNAARLERAKLLLRDTDLTVSQIAYRVGFDGPAYFCRLFRRRTGLSPKTYARSHRPTAEAARQG